MASAVDVQALATAGDGTEAAPFTGWNASLTPAAFTRYQFQKGWYRTKPVALNWAASGIEIIGEAGVYYQHGGSGDCFIWDAGATPGTAWYHNPTIKDIIVKGRYFAGSGTAVATAGSDQVVGAGTAFLTQFAVGNAITFNGGQATCVTRIVSAIADDTHLTVSSNFATNKSGAYTICTTANGFFFRGMRTGIAENLRAQDISNAGLWTEACVTNVLTDFECNENDNATYNVRPRYGIVTAGRGGITGDWSTIWTIINPCCEGQWDKGIWLKNESYGHAVIGGTSEGHVEIAVGAQIDCNYAVINNLDCEANASEIDFSVKGNYNSFAGILSDKNFIVSGSHNTLSVGHYQNLTLTPTGGACYNNVLLNPKVLGTLTDGGNATRFIAKTGSDFRYKLGVALPEVTTANISNGVLATNAAIGELFVNLGISSHFTLSNPTNAADGQEIAWRLTANGGGPYNITYGNKFRAMNGLALPATLDASATRYIVGRWNTTEQKMDIFTC